MNSWSSKKALACYGEGVCSYYSGFFISSSVQFYDQSRLPCPCRPESRKRNTCVPASVFCNLCRSILPYRQVRRVTNIYVLSFCVLLLVIFCPNTKQFIYFILLRHSYCLFIVMFHCAAVRATVWKLSSFKAVMAGITVIKVQSIVTSLFFMESFRKSLCSSGRTGSW